MKGRLTQALGGALVFTTFGCAWGAFGVYSLKQTDRPWLLAVPLALAMLMILGQTKLQRKVEALPDDPVTRETAARDARSRKFFVIVNLAQGLAIFLAVQVWANLHKPEYLAPTIALIVGLHFFALAKPMGLPSHWVVGGLMCALAAGLMAAVPAESWGWLVGLGNAAILWTASLHRLHEVLEGVRGRDSAI